MNCNKIKLDVFKYITPSIQHRSVKDKDSLRVVMAKKQLEKYDLMIAQGYKKEKILQKIVDVVNDILSKMEMSLPDDYNSVITIENGVIDYKSICNGINIANRDDIVWIKLNSNGCISVIGTSRDIRFDNETKLTTTAGKINRFVNQKWDNKKVLIFPLINIPDGMNRSDVESVIGNYLIANDIPILDFYSHVY